MRTRPRHQLCAVAVSAVAAVVASAGAALAAVRLPIGATVGSATVGRQLRQVTGIYLSGGCGSDDSAPGSLVLQDDVPGEYVRFLDQDPSRLCPASLRVGYRDIGLRSQMAFVAGMKIPGSPPFE